MSFFASYARSRDEFSHLINRPEIFPDNLRGSVFSASEGRERDGTMIASKTADVIKIIPMDAPTLGLTVILSLVLVGPFLNKWVESNLEIFLFVMGAVSATLSNAWTSEVVREGFVAPINITLAVLAAGVLFHYTRRFVDRGMRRVLITVPLPAIVCIVIVSLGLLSSIISAIIAALLLVEFITVLPLYRHAEVNLTIIAFFAIGLGAALSPLGEPLSTIVVSKLSGEPYHASFGYLARLLAPYVVPAVIALGIVGMFLVRQVIDDTEASLAADEEEK